MHTSTEMDRTAERSRLELSPLIVMWQEKLASRVVARIEYLEL